MKQILFVNLQGNMAGAEQSLLLLIKYLHNDYHCVVACPAFSSLSRQLDEMKIESLPLPKPSGRYSSRFLWLIYLITASLILCKIVHKIKPELLHANGFYPAIVSLFPVFLMRRKLIWHARDLTRFQITSKICSLFCQRVIAVSKTVKSLLIRHGIKPEIIDIVYNGIEIENLNDKGKAVARFKKNNCPIRFANIGQFVPWKKQGLFLNAASKLVARGVNAEFLLIGDDIFGRNSKYRSLLIHQVHNCHIAERITLLGWQENMQEVWPQIDCLVHTASAEPFGRVIIEAMAHKIPIIAVGCCGPSEIIQNGKTGILVPVDDAEALSKAMLKIANDRKFAKELTLAGSERVISYFQAERTVDCVREIYKHIFVA
ncbi:glycosyltransferase family 4 protein [Planctomycetota bacterium]